MEQEKINKLFEKKYLQPEYKFNGLILKPVMDEKYGTTLFGWEIENPNNVSYNTDLITDFIRNGIIYDFEKLTGFTLRPLKKYTLLKGEKGVFLSNEDKNKIRSILKNIDTFEANIYKLKDDVKLVSDVIFNRFKLINNDDGLIIETRVKLINPKIIRLYGLGKNEPLPFTGIYLSTFIDLVNSDVFHDRYHHFLKSLNEFIWQNYHIFNADYMYTEISLEFELPDGTVVG